MRLLRGALVAAASLLANAGITVVPANDATRITWMGRTAINAAGGVTFDWEGTSLFFTVANASIVHVNILDNTGSGSTFVTYMYGPSTGSQWLKVGTWPTSPGNGTYMISRGLSSDTITYQVKHNSEPCFMGTGPGANVTVLSIDTDGVVMSAPALPSRKIEIIGDSITAGMGAAFDGPCDANIFQNSYDNTYTDIICRNLSAACHSIAWSGIGISCFYGDPNGQPCDPAVEYQQNMPWTYTYTLGAMRQSGDVTDAKWDFSRFVPDAIIINLGTNDWSGGRANNATFQAIYVQTYVQFVRNITHVYYNNPALPLFLAMGPLDMAPLSAVQQVVTAHNAAGGNATLLALPAPGLPIGCAGHPSPSMHAYMANTAIPVMKQVLRW